MSKGPNKEEQMKEASKAMYRNLFVEFGIADERTVDERVKETFDTIFFGPEDQKFYHEVGYNMGYMRDTGNDDARTEGMSYGMMMAVQMGNKDIFDRLWLWTKTYMYLDEGPNAGYFCWSNATDGTKNADGPAPDGEEFFAMALIFASKRWGDGEGVFDYMSQARELLSVMIHKGEDGSEGRAMWDPDNKLIRFITPLDFSDPSYHLPHFYDLFAEYCNPEDRDFWLEAAKNSRDYLVKACHKDTGLSAEYADFDGTPHVGHEEIFGRHDWYYSDAYRTVANVALDWAWFQADVRFKKIAENLQRFFCETVADHPFGIYAIDGTILEGEALHPVAMTAVNAQASLASDGEHAVQCVQKFWDTPLREGDRRYYDNCLYMFAMLALSGNYRIY